MHRYLLSTAVLAIVSRVAADGASDWAAQSKKEVISFVDGDWEDKCEGEIFPIKWSKGNGKQVGVKVKGEGWEEEICSEGAAPGETTWEVEVPKCDCEYSIWLKQEECEELESPKFYVACAADDYDNKNGWGNKAQPTVTVVWDDKDCSCQKTKTTVAPYPTKTVWYDEEAKCSVTISTAAPAKPTGNGWGDKPVAPAETGKEGWGKPAAPTETGKEGWAKPVADATASPANGWATPAAASPSVAKDGWASPAAPVAPATGVPKVDAYKGAATKVGASAFAMVAVFGAALFL